MSSTLRIGRNLLFFVALVLPLSSFLSLRAQDTGRKVIKKVDPQYPTELKRRGIGGTVRLRVYIKPDGTVRQSQLIGGNPVLGDAAEKAVAQWHFTPASSETTTEVTVLFTPDSR